MNNEELAQELALIDPVELAMGAGMAGAIATMMLVFGAVWYFGSAIGYYKMYVKAGEAGWKAFIPYYRTFVRFKFAWSTNKFWIFLVTLLVIEFYSNFEGAISEMATAPALLVNLLAIVCGIVCIVMSVKLDIRVAKSFGKTTGWGVLLCFFPFI
ncbi:MAG: hypothetical protein IIV70_06145, partial [Peptococcaceae bacterium]|nr:hypothetical protein [Peptococcaceae bacterium]